MAKPLDLRIQFFADQITQKIQHLESELLNGYTHEEEKKRMAQSEVLEELLEKFESVFGDILYSD